MKRSATSSARLSFPPSRCRKRDGVGRAESERERQLSRLRPPPLSRLSGGPPPAPAYPIPIRPPWAHDPWEERGSSERPHGRQAHLPRGSCRRHPLGPGLPGSNRLSIQLPVARRPGRARPTPLGRSPGLDFATFPTPEGEPGGNQGQLGGREEVRRPPATAGAGKGVQEPGSRQQVSRGLPPPTPWLTSCAFKFRPVAPWPPEPSALPNHKKNTTRKRPPQTPRRWSRAPEGPVTSPPLTPPAAGPVTARTQGPLPGRRRQRLELPPPRRLRRLGLLPL